MPAAVVLHRLVPCAQRLHTIDVGWSAADVDAHLLFGVQLLNAQLVPRKPCVAALLARELEGADLTGCGDHTAVTATLQAFTAGTTVLLHNLSVATQYNNATAVLVCPAAGGKWIVAVGTRRVKVHPSKWVLLNNIDVCYKSRTGAWALEARLLPIKQNASGTFSVNGI